MKEKIYDYSGSKMTFSTFFIIKNNYLYSTKYFDVENKFENCFYVKKLGSNVHPKIYFSEKKNNKWIKSNVLIGGYNSFMDFIANNESSIICIRGFSKSLIGEFVLALNKLKNMNIKPVKFVSDAEQPAVTKIMRKDDNRGINLIKKK